MNLSALSLCQLFPLKGTCVRDCGAANGAVAVNWQPPVCPKSKSELWWGASGFERSLSTRGVATDGAAFARTQSTWQAKSAATTERNAATTNAITPRRDQDDRDWKGFAVISAAVSQVV